MQFFSVLFIACKPLLGSSWASHILIGPLLASSGPLACMSCQVLADIYLESSVAKPEKISEKSSFVRTVFAQNITERTSNFSKE
jgi:hypothetical protein